MNRKDLCSSFDQIDDDILERSEAAVKSGRKTVWMKWGAAAACLCLCLSAVIAQSYLRGSRNPDVPPVGTDAPPVEPDRHPGNPENEGNSTLSLKTSDTYANLGELLAYLSKHDDHRSDRQEGASSGVPGIASDQGDGQLERKELVENTGVAVSTTGEYSYHIGEDAVYISRLDGGQTQNAGKIDGAAEGIFICSNNLLVISQYASGDDPLSEEISTCVKIYDITVPQNPVLQDEYIQGGRLSACWMSGAALYLVTGDGVCACGWSRLKDPAEYYPSLIQNGKPVAWGDDDISILGEPTRVQYAAITAINGNSREVISKNALYGNILKLFYGADWLAATVAGETATARENPVVYTFDPELKFAGKINTAQIMNAPEKNVLEDYVPQNGKYLSIVSVAKHDGIYRMLGTYASLDEAGTASYFMALTADAETGETGSKLLGAESYPNSIFTEVLWEKDRAVACVGTTKIETRFLFAEFHGLEVSFHENELTADYLGGRVGVSYGNPLDQFRTLIPMGNGIYVRYSNFAEGPGGFDVFDFSDSSAPLCLYRASNSLSGDDAFDYVWYVYDEHTFGTLKVLLGAEDYLRNVNLSWCVYTVDTSDETTIALKSETSLDKEIRTYIGADVLGYAVFHVGNDVYYITREMTSAALLDI
ncbi:MAG: beta-propeller domain-containing protein [Agathobacter sp.]|nr:beta-propeller domain-containing protein [Agathobacter sp.]